MVASWALLGTCWAPLGTSGALPGAAQAPPMRAILELLEIILNQHLLSYYVLYKIYRLIELQHYKELLLVMI